MIYLDNAATTMPSKTVLSSVNKWLEEKFFNPSALYYDAQKLGAEIETARATVAGVVHCPKNEVFFTSGATESNNWAVACGRKNKKGNIVITDGEHPSVYEPIGELKGKGADVRIVPLESSGAVDEERLLKAVDENTSFVSVIHVSNETGAVNDVVRIAEKVKRKAPSAVFHSDGVQAFGKVPVDLSRSSIDLYSVSAHKIGGLKGCGALVVRGGKIAPFMLGGGQERRLRSGTENVLGILSFGAAISDIAENNVSAVYDFVVDYLKSLDGVQVNGDIALSSKYIISAGVRGVKSEVLQHLMSDDGVLIGLGSACSSKTKKNRVLESMGVEKEYIDGNIRLSFFNRTTLDEAKTAMTLLRKNILFLREKTA